MPSKPPHHFDDPALRAALRSQLGVDPAPSALRDRIQRLFADTSAPIPLAGKPRSFSLYARWITSAAAILLVGFIIFQTYRSSTLPAPGGGSPFPQATLVAL